jgi:hypothetical protein
MPRNYSKTQQLQSNTNDIQVKENSDKEFKRIIIKNINEQIQTLG